jgi:serine/threonine protein kinase
MAPELFDPVSDQRRTLAELGPLYTEAVDTYAFAVIISELLTGELPWAHCLFDQLRQKVRAPPGMSRRSRCPPTRR